MNGPGDTQRCIEQARHHGAVDIIAAQPAQVLWQDFRKNDFDDGIVADIELDAKSDHGRQGVEILLPLITLVFIHRDGFAPRLEALNRRFLFDVHRLLRLPLPGRLTAVF